MQIVATRIFELIKAQNKTQQDLANYLGISKQTVSGWKKPKNNSYMNYLVEISNFFEVSADYLLGREEQQDTDPQISSNEPTPLPISYLAGAKISDKPIKTKYAPVEMDKSVMPDILKSFSSAELKKLSSLSRDQADEVVRFVDDLLSHK